MQVEFMELRPELLPPLLDQLLVDRLTALADHLDGTPDQAMLAEFNRLAESELSMAEFQGISGGEDHEDFVRRTLLRGLIRPVPDVTREELIEVVRRAMPSNGFLTQCEAYMAIFDANVPLPGASNLIFNPPDYEPETNTWGGGRPLSDYAPTPAQIVEWALDQR